MTFDNALGLVKLIDEAETIGTLGLIMIEVAEALGYRQFAIANHTDSKALSAVPARLHNYPVQWEATYDQHLIALRDPVRRACQVTSLGFSWAEMPSMIDLAESDRRTLGLGRSFGIVEGFTVPANVPGQTPGSCTFARDEHWTSASSAFPVVQLVGAFAVNRARLLWAVQRSVKADHAVLSDRQRECLLWVARGKSD